MSVFNSFHYRTRRRIGRTGRVRSPITSTSTPVSAAAEQQHDDDDNQN
jgi:hypothetical protein